MFPYEKECKLSWNEVDGGVFGVPTAQEGVRAGGTAVTPGTAADGAARAASGAGGEMGKRELSAQALCGWGINDCEEAEGVAQLRVSLVKQSCCHLPPLRAERAAAGLR